jgi:hypothetical protein
VENSRGGRERTARFIPRSSYSPPTDPCFASNTNVVLGRRCYGRPGGTFVVIAVVKSSTFSTDVPQGEERTFSPARGLCRPSCPRTLFLLRQYTHIDRCDESMIKSKNDEACGCVNAANYVVDFYRQQPKMTAVTIHLLPSSEIWN